MRKVLKVLAVGDPAVYAYTDESYNLVNNFKGDFTVDFNIVPWSEYYSTMMEAFQGKITYDIVMVAGHLWLKDFINKGYIAQVDIGEDCDYEYEDILPVIREEIEVDGATYLYPSFCDGHVVLYRKSIVEKVLGNLPGKSITTDELIDMAALCSGYNKMHGIVLKAHPSEIFLDFLPYLRNEGVDAINKNTHAPEFNNEKGVKALKKYLSLKAFSPTNTGSFGNEELKNAFQKKESVIAVTWGGQIGTVLGEGCQDPEDIGFAALETSWNVTWSFAINSLSDKKPEANEFLKFITNKKADRVIGSYAGSPVRKSTYLMDRNKHSWYDMHLELIEKYARPLPKLLNAGDKFSVLYELISKVFNSEITIKDCLEQAEDKINKI